MYFYQEIYLLSTYLQFTWQIMEILLLSNSTYSYEKSYPTKPVKKCEKSVQLVRGSFVPK